LRIINTWEREVEDDRKESMNGIWKGKDGEVRGGRTEVGMECSGVPRFHFGVYI